MTQALIDLLSTPWSYPVILGIAALDALVPVVPSETLAITGGVLAGLGDLHLGTVLASAAVGAFIGDSAGYLLGRKFGPRARDRLFRGRRAQRTLNWAEKQLTERGAYLILIARFIPGGRTATTFTAGMVRLRPALFVSPMCEPPAVLFANLGAGGDLSQHVPLENFWHGAPASQR